jgi:hypothetical protein
MNKRFFLYPDMKLYVVQAHEPLGPSIVLGVWSDAERAYLECIKSNARSISVVTLNVCILDEGLDIEARHA